MVNLFPSPSSQPPTHLIFQTLLVVRLERVTSHAGFLLVLQPLAILDVALYVSVRGSVAVDGKKVSGFVDLLGEYKVKYYCSFVYSSQFLTSISRTPFSNRNPIFNSPYRPGMFKRQPFGWICPGPSFVTPDKDVAEEISFIEAADFIGKFEFACMQLPTEPRHFKLFARVPPPPVDKLVLSNWASKSSWGELLAGCTCEVPDNSGTAAILSFRTRLDPGIG